MTAIDLDRQRRRWGDARRLDRLDLEDTDGFAKGGLGAHVEALDLRIRFLPADPLATLVRLDGEAEEWLCKPRPSPYGGREPELGQSKRATSSALVRYDRYRDDQGWTRFVGLHRDGSLDFGEGSSICGAPRRKIRSASTSRGARSGIWRRCRLKRSNTGVSRGRSKSRVALAGVEGARLGGFAEGWRDVGDMFFRDAPTCVEPNVLLRLECDILDPEALAMDVGSGSKTFRLDASAIHREPGDFEARFDPRF